MNQVKLIWKTKNLRKIISIYSSNQSSINILNLGSEIISIIKDYELQKIHVFTINDLVDNNSIKFLKDYRDLIGVLSKYFDSRHWWATNIASKNRFTSQIPLLIQQIEACSIAINKEYKNLIIFCPDFAIIATLEDLISQAGLRSNIPKIYVYFKLLFERCCFMIGHLKSLLYLYHRLIIMRLFFNKKFYTSKSKYVLKTFFYESTIDEKKAYSYHDPMFGKLPEFLEKNGNLLILTQIIDNYKICIDKINRHKEFNIIPIEYWLSATTIFKSFIHIMFYSLGKNIPVSLQYRGINVSAIFKSELFKKCNDIYLNQYIYYEIISKCFISQRLDQYIHTYENNPWEKMTIAAIRNISPATIIIGFQHAVVPPSSVNLFNSSHEYKKMPLPDKIISVGKEPLDIINEFSHKPIKNAEIGCGLRYEYLQLLDMQPRREIHNILVIPEGVINVIPMLNYVIRELNHNKKYQITFRFHPSLPYKTIKNKLDFNLINYNNMNISGLSLEEDLFNADLCIYWGSTVALEALSMGIPLIHYNMQTKLSFDPLFRCNNLKWNVTNNDSLCELIETINSLSNKEYIWKTNQAKEYINRYFYPVNDNNMSKFLYN